MTTFQRGLLLFCLGVFFTFSCSLSFLCGRKSVRKWSPRPLADTIYVADTSHHEEPEPAEVIPAGSELVRVGTVAQLQKAIAALKEAAAVRPDSAPTASPALQDSTVIEVPLPVERKVYGGEEGDDYRAVVSGIFPKLESIDVYPKTAYINTPVQYPAKRSSRLSFGFTAGPGLFWDGKAVKPGAGVTAGLSWTF